MSLTLSLPAFDTQAGETVETRPSKVVRWLNTLADRDPLEAARAMVQSLTQINRTSLADGRRFQLAEHYWTAAVEVWPLLERRFAHVVHPLVGDALDCAKTALALSLELSVAYKHLLAREADKRPGGVNSRQLSVKLERALDATARTITHSYLAYSPVPTKTWLDAHRIHVFARDRNLHVEPFSPDDPERTPERVYLELLLLALANPYGLAPGQLATVIRYLHAHAPLAKLTDVQPVHRMAKAVAIVPIGHDFPPFSASKGGAIEGRKLYLLTYDLAFEIQEQLRALDAGGQVPATIARDNASRRTYAALLRRLLKQWAIPPARQFNRVPSKAPVLSCTGLADVVQYARAARQRASGQLTPLPEMTHCEVINHTPAGYALRQSGGRVTPLRIGELLAVAPEGRDTLHVAVVRWFRNTLDQGALEFGCELLSDAPRVAQAAPEGLGEDALLPALVLPPFAKTEDAGFEVVVPLGLFRVEQAITLEQDDRRSFVVLTKLVEQGAGFEIYEFIAVG